MSHIRACKRQCPHAIDTQRLEIERKVHLTRSRYVQVCFAWVMTLPYTRERTPSQQKMYGRFAWYQRTSTHGHIHGYVGLLTQTPTHINNTYTNPHSYTHTRSDIDNNGESRIGWRQRTFCRRQFVQWPVEGVNEYMFRHRSTRDIGPYPREKDRRNNDAISYTFSLSSLSLHVCY